MNPIKYISFVGIYVELFEQPQIFVLKGSSGMMLFLIMYIFDNSINANVHKKMRRIPLAN
jgi:hypothetical protein